MATSKTTTADDSLKTTANSVDRSDRASADQARTDEDGTAVSMAERRRQMRAEWAQDVLPQPPVVPGWHFCWLSTTNSSDPIYKRMQKGYIPVKVHEIPGFGQYAQTSGEFEGCVACNEMLLFKIEEELYQDIMRYFHSELPNEEEEMLRANAKIQDTDTNGQPLGQMEGFDSFGRVRDRNTTFS